jgi:hypothetical protein
VFAEPDPDRRVMVTKPPSGFAMGFVLLLSAAAARSEHDSLLSKVHDIPPCAELLAVAQAQQVPVVQIDPLSDAGQLNAGDSITALVLLNEKGQRITQWLLYLRAAVNSRAQPSNTMVMYSSTGSKMEFHSVPVPVTLRTFGPFDASPRQRALKRQDKAADFSLDQGFLALGLDNAAVALLRLRQSKVKGSFGFSNKRFSDAEIAKTRHVTRPVQLTGAEERALAGAAPALLSYFNVVQRTEGLSDILFELIDLPSMWSLLRGVNTNFRFINENLQPGDDTAWGLPDRLRVYYLPIVLELNKHPALNITFVATSPRPPLLPCAGVVALLAEKPGDKRTYLTLRIISARRSSAAPVATGTLESQ